MMDYIMSASPWVLGILALIAGMIGWNLIKSGQSNQVKGVSKVLAILLAVALAINLGWIAMDSDTETLTTAEGPAVWDATPTSSSANTTVTGDDILTHYTMANGAFRFAATGAVTISFACIRTDVSIADSVAQAYVVSVPSVTNTTSGISHPLVTSDANGVYDADFTVSGVTSPMSTTYPADNEARTATVSLTITFSAAAIEAIPQYSTVTIQYSVGGVIFDHDIMNMT